MRHQPLFGSHASDVIVEGEGGRQEGLARGGRRGGRRRAADGAPLRTVDRHVQAARVVLVRHDLKSARYTISVTTGKSTRPVVYLYLTSRSCRQPTKRETPQPRRVASGSTRTIW